jgi:dUTP pyrophosphatase
MLRIVTDDPNQFQKAHSVDAGYDILSSEDKKVSAGSRALISTGLRVAIPEGYVGIIKPRSGLSVKHSIDIGAGVVDSGYTGEVKVCFINNGKVPYHIKKGNKIAQMVVVPIYTEEVKRVASIEESERSEGGFNSSGY